MKKRFLHTLLAGVLVLLAASCSGEDVPRAGAEKQKVMIRFTIALDEQKPASRSWEGYDPEYNPDGDDTTDDAKGEVGTVNENTITNVHALMYDTNGVLMGLLNVVDVEAVTTSTNEHVYTVIGSVEVDADKVGNLDFKLMVLANCSLPSDLNSLSTLTFTRPTTTDGTGIPMWGIATYTGVDLSGCLSADTAFELFGDDTNYEPVYMLRSMAKIEVTLSDETKEAGYTLTGATLDKVLGSGFVMPTLQDDSGEDLTLATLEATTELGLEKVFHPTSGTASEISVEGDGNTVVFYVPEYEVTEDNPLNISLNLKQGETEVTPTRSFKHGYYEEGSYQNAWNVVRNHYYKYTVSIKNGVDLEVIITINEWNYRDVTYPNTSLTN